MIIPSLLLKQLYSRGTLRNVENGVEFSLKNRLKDATLKKLFSIKINDNEIPLSDIVLDFGNGNCDSKGILTKPDGTSDEIALIRFRR